MSGSHSSPSSKSRIAALGLLVNIALAGAKLLAGLLGNSYALIADAAESLTDILGSVVIWSGLRYGSRPADADHPWGHGKAEALAALVVGAIVFLAGIGIGVQAASEIITPHHTPALFTLIVLLIVVIIKETMFRLARRVSKKEASDAVAVDAFHHRSDAITSVAAFVGISLAIFVPRFTGLSKDAWAPADDYAALVASAVILYNAWNLIKLPLRELMDQQPAELIPRVREVAATIPGVLAIEKCRARSSGSRAYIEIHVQVDPSISVTQGHSIGGRVRAAIRDQLPTVSDVHVHIEPHESLDLAMPVLKKNSE